MANDPNTNPGGDGETIAATSASGGQKTGHIRWVLGIGVVLAVAAMAIAWFLTTSR
jgi:hypothetical protein